MAAQICETCKKKGARCYCAPNSTCEGYETEENPVDEAFKKITKYLSENNPKVTDAIIEMGINLYNEDGSFRTVFEILSEISEKYVDRGDVDAAI